MLKVESLAWGRHGERHPRRAWAGITTALHLMRVDKPLAAMALTLLGAWLAGSAPALRGAPVWLAAGCVFFITAFGFVINDCCDRPVDAIAKPGRPLPAGQWSARAAWLLAAMLASAGLALGAALGAVAAAFAVGAVALGGLYSLRLKRTVLWGNASVALLVSAVLVFGGVAAGGATTAVWAAAGVSFSYVLAQEALFTLEDEDGDRAAGLRTTATALGTQAAGRLVRVLFVIFMAVSLLPVWLAHAGWPYAVAMAVCCCLPVLVMLRWLRAPVESASVARAARLSRWVWVSSFLPLALLK